MKRFDLFQAFYSSHTNIHTTHIDCSISPVFKYSHISTAATNSIVSAKSHVLLYQL